jgi:hypothetical protein
VKPARQCRRRYRNPEGRAALEKGSVIPGPISAETSLNRPSPWFLYQARVLESLPDIVLINFRVDVTVDLMMQVAVVVIVNKPQPQATWRLRFQSCDVGKGAVSVVVIEIASVVGKVGLKISNQPSQSQSPTPTPIPACSWPFSLWRPASPPCR